MRFSEERDEDKETFPVPRVHWQFGTEENQMITVKQQHVLANTKTLTALFDRGRLVSLKRKSDGKEFMKSGTAETIAPLQLVYPKEDPAPLSGNPGDGVKCLQVGEGHAEMRFESWNGDGIIAISEDAETGDLIVEPSAYSSRPGLWACRWNIGLLADGVELIAPFFQGVRLPLEDKLIRNSRWHWPHFWEAGLAILQGADGGVWFHCRDTGYRYKALQVGTAAEARCIGFDTEAYGPLDNSLGAGGLAWRINVYKGDWKKPAGAYRDWLWKAYGLNKVTRPDWVEKLRFAVSWCPSDVAVLKALAKRLDPKKVLLHIPNWRRDGYDENYPSYIASDKGKKFIAAAQSRGFRAMPHCNSVDMDPSHPAYAYLRDFQYRDVVSKRVQGWTWMKGKILPVQESNVARLKHRDKKTMVKIHPGLAMWRSILAENVGKAVEAHGLEAVFLDVTLCSWNVHNGLVENQTTTEGMKRLVEQVANLKKNLAVGGEGRNEITMQGEAFGQVHLFKSWQQSIDGLERTGECALNEFLFGRLCRSFGYTGLNGVSPVEEVRMRIHTDLGAIPTVTIGSAADIDKPNKAVKEMLDAAND
jgi:hypothetical protein